MAIFAGGSLSKKKKKKRAGYISQSFKKRIVGNENTEWNTRRPEAVHGAGTGTGEGTGTNTSMQTFLAQRHRDRHTWRRGRHGNAGDTETEKDMKTRET